jgi:hypothetical protein
MNTRPQRVTRALLCSKKLTDGTEASKICHEFYFIKCIFLIDVWNVGTEINGRGDPLR